MGDLVTITTTGRATADVELKTSTNGKIPNTCSSVLP